MKTSLKVLGELKIFRNEKKKKFYKLIAHSACNAEALNGHRGAESGNVIIFCKKEY